MRDATQWAINIWEIQEDISIHASHAGCDRQFRYCYTYCTLFQSTHPMRDATQIRSCFRILFSRYFNPRIPCGMRHELEYHQDITTKYFNPRIPCGMRPVVKVRVARLVPFQSTHPMRDATTREMINRVNNFNFNPRIPCGMRRQNSHF